MFLWPPKTGWPKGSGRQKRLQPFASIVKIDCPAGKCGAEASASRSKPGR